MSDMSPYTPAILARLIADAKASMDRGKPEELFAACRGLLPWSGCPDVDRALGRLFNLLLRHGNAIRIADFEGEAFGVDRLLRGWKPQDASVPYPSWNYRQVFVPDCDPDVAKTTSVMTDYRFLKLWAPTSIN
jgi:hypothetical protein